MTSPSIRRQRQSDRQNPIPQPNFGHPNNTGQVGSISAAGPLAPAQGTIDWNQRLQQGYQSRHALRLQNRGRQRLEPNESLPVAGPSVPVQGRVDQYIPIAGPSAPIAGPSRSVQERVDWNSRFQQEFQARHNNQRQTHSLAGNQNHSVIGPSQHIIGWQERYADEERQHASHLAELLRQQNNQRQLEAEQHHAHMAEQQQILQQNAAEHLQVVINNNQAL